jgi:hypothetical protein
MDLALAGSASAMPETAKNRINCAFLGLRFGADANCRALNSAAAVACSVESFSQ